MDVRVDLVKGKVYRSIILYSLPFLLSNIFQQLYNAIDIVIVGNALDENAVAAIGVCGGIYELIVGFAVGICAGLSIVMAKYYGAEDEKMLRKSIASSFFISAIITVIIMILTYKYMYTLLEVLNTPDEIIQAAYDYIVIIGLGVGTTMAFNLLSGILKAMGNSFVPLIFLIISTIINIVLDIVFISIMGMNVEGAAIATVVAQGLSVIMCFIYVVRKCRYILPHREDFRFESKLNIELWLQAVSMGLMSCIVSIGTIILQFAINGFNTFVLAGHTAARKLLAISTLPISTMGMSIAPYVSQNRGANKPERIWKGFVFVNIITTIWSFIAIGIIVPFAEFFVSLISGSDNSTVIEIGSDYLKFNVLFYVALGILINTRCALQGLGSKIMPILSSIIELVGKIIFTIEVIPLMGYKGVIISEPIVWCVMMVQLVISFVIIFKNKYKNVGASLVK